MQSGGLGGAALAGWGSRVGAALLDGLILVIPVVILIAIIGAVASGSEAGGIVSALLGVLAYLIVVLFYAPVLMKRQGQNNGQTFGKQIVGIRVARDNGQQFDFGSALLREFVVKGLLFNGLGSLLFGLPGLIDVLWPLWDDENRSLHDMVVSTHVVRA